MNNIRFNNVSLPVVSACDSLAAQEPFLHADRIADFHVMIYVTEGCIFVTEDKVDYEISAGNLFFLKSGIRHFGKKEIKRGTRWHYVHFYISEPFRNMSCECLSPCYLTLPKKLCHLSDSLLEQKILEFTRYYHREDPACVWDRNLRFFQLLTEIAQSTREENVEICLSDRIAQYLTRNYASPFSSRKLEQHFFLSYKHMAAVFKKEKHMTMQQFHTGVRMENACRLLRSTLLPIGKIGRSVGYTDILYFSRCFHRLIGMSPTEYRKLPHEY